MRRITWLLPALAGLVAAPVLWPAFSPMERRAEGRRAAEQDYASFVRALERAREPAAAPEPSLIAVELERAHDARRRGDWDAALERYEAVSWGIADARSRARAEHWRARTLELAGRESDARRAWANLAEHARDPCERLRARDRMALALAAEGARDEALRVLARCLDDCSPRASEASEHGARVARALASMRAPRELGLDGWPSREHRAPSSDESESEENVPARELDCSQAPLR